MRFHNSELAPWVGYESAEIDQNSSSQMKILCGKKKKQLTKNTISAFFQIGHSLKKIFREEWRVQNFFVNRTNLLFTIYFWTSEPEEFNSKFSILKYWDLGVKFFKIRVLLFPLYLVWPTLNFFFWNACTWPNSPFRFRGLFFFSCFSYLVKHSN